MKKFSIIRCAVLSASILTLTTGHAQAVAGDRLASIDPSRVSSVKAVSPSETSADARAIMSLRARNFRMFDHFTQEFQNARQIKVTSENNGTRVSFYRNDVLNKVFYNQRGRWQYSIRYYEGAKLSAPLQNQVAEAYPRYNLFGFVTEIVIPGQTAYLVMIENKTSWKRVRMTNGEMDTYEEYQKP